MSRTNNKAAIYLRSSKDRNEVSIDAQRRELQKLALAQGLNIIQEFSDVVESAKDENRPGFQQLLNELKSSSRKWSSLLLVDTSRLSRRRYMAQVFKHEAQKRNVKIIYSKLPESDPIADMVIVGVMEVFDELHSLMSKEKGLAGMAENVRQGFRAGGRAPRGYQLEKIATGAVRDGEAVTKSRLVPNEDAPLIGQYLKMRLTGASRKRAIAELDLGIASTTAIELEWNALTYAGHTVWNVRNEHKKGEGYKGNQKRRPRSEWVIKENTHEALISTEEAEALLAQLENSVHHKAKTRRTKADYLLTGLLQTPQGEPWFGNGRNGYLPKKVAGIRNRKIDKEAMEQAVLKQVSSDLRSPEFIKTLTREAIKYREAHQADPAESLRPEVNKLTQKISSLMNMATELADPAPALREVEQLEQKRNALVSEIERREQEYSAAALLDHFTEANVKTFLNGIASDMEIMDREAKKDFLSLMIDRIVLDPVSHDAEVCYRFSADLRNKMASPRGDVSIPVLPATTQVTEHYKKIRSRPRFSRRV